MISETFYQYTVDILDCIESGHFIRKKFKMSPKYWLYYKRDIFYAGNFFRNLKTVATKDNFYYCISPL